MAYNAMTSNVIANALEAVNANMGIAMSSVKQDLTINAEITKLVNVDTGEYKVKYEGNIFSAFSIDSTVTYDLEEQVYVLVPQSDFSAKKLILGRSAYRNDVQYTDVQDFMNFYVDRSPNMVVSADQTGNTDGFYKVEYQQNLAGEKCLEITAASNSLSETGGSTEFEELEWSIDSNGQPQGPAYFESYGFQRDWSIFRQALKRFQAWYGTTVGLYQSVLCDYDQSVVDTFINLDLSNVSYRNVDLKTFLENNAPGFFYDLTDSAETGRLLNLTTENRANYDNWVRQYQGWAGRLTENNYTGVLKTNQDYNYVAKTTNKGWDDISRSMSDTDLELADAKFVKYNKNYEYIHIKADFKTDFLNFHNEGKFGLLVQLLTRNQNYTEDFNSSSYNSNQIAESPYRIIPLYLDQDNFEGSLYYYSDWTTQEAWFKVDKESVLGIYRIGLIQNGMLMDKEISYGSDGEINNTRKINAETNIFVRNIHVSFAQKINLTNSLFYPYIELPMGTEFSNQITQIDLIPHLLYGHKDLMNNIDCKVQWFIQDAKVTRNYFQNILEQDERRKYPTDYSGPGYYPIQLLIDNWPPNTNCPYYIDPETQTLTITHDGTNWNAVEYINRYKAVISYMPNNTSGLTGLSTTEASAVSDFDTSENDIGLIEISNLNSLYRNLHFEQIQEVINGVNYTRLQIVGEKRETVDDEFEDYEVNYSETQGFVGQWYVNFNNEYDLATKGLLEVAESNKLSINQYMIQDYVNFWVSIYDVANLVDDSTLNDNPFTCLVHTSIKPTEEDLHIQWNCNPSHFSYDALGSLKTLGGDMGGPHTCSPIISWLNDSAADYRCEIYGPGMVKLNPRSYHESVEDASVDAEGLGYNPENSMLKNLFIENAIENANIVIHFKVYPHYEVTKTNNTFTLKIILDDREFVAHKEITFSKDGDTGTIGNDWTMKLRPCNWYDYGQRNVEQNIETAFGEALDNRAKTFPLVGYYDDEEVDVPYTSVWCTENSTSKQKLTGWMKVKPIVIDPNFRLFLRPFVYYQNEEIATQLDPTQAYFFKAYWDVRIPSNAAPESGKLASFLRLYHVDGWTTAEDVQNNRPFIRDVAPNLYEDGGTARDLVSISEYYEKRNSLMSDGNTGYYYYGTGGQVTKTPMVNTEGLTGFTMYPWTEYENYNAERPVEVNGEIVYEPIDKDEMDKTFGAIEVKFFDNHAFGTGCSLENVSYRVLVKCQVDIYKGEWDGHSISPSSSPQRIATLHDAYPVDLLLFKDKDSYNAWKQEANSVIDSNGNPVSYLRFNERIEMNWPSRVIYNSAGYDPIAYPGLQDGVLSFRYGQNLDPSTNTKYMTWNLTSEIQSVEAPNSDDPLYQIYKPNSFLDYTEGFYGALATTKFTRQATQLTIARNVNGETSGNTDNATEAAIEAIDSTVSAHSVIVVSDSDSISEEALTQATPFNGGIFIHGIQFLTNGYENVDINGWDGESISTNNDNGSLMAVKIGAGYKQPLSNKFCGVVIGTTDVLKSSIINNEDAGYTEDEYNSNKYLSGLIGYQDSIQSFAFFENGTGFIGRADRGGRIIFDGSNAVIEGGGNGISKSPTIADGMWNKMRISLIDLNHAKDNWFRTESYGELGTVEIPFDPKSLIDNICSGGETEDNQSEETAGGSSSTSNTTSVTICDPNNVFMGTTPTGTNGGHGASGNSIGRGGSDVVYLVDADNGAPGLANTNFIAVPNMPYECDNDSTMVLGYRSDYYNENDFPYVFKAIWRRAYLKFDNQTPYWFKEPQYKTNMAIDEDHDAEAVYAELPWLTTFEDMVDYVENQGDYKTPTGDVEDENRGFKINYYDGCFLKSLDGSSIISPEVIQQWTDYVADLNNEGTELYKKYKTYLKYVDNEGVTQQTTFGPSRASTTPAIEIGQHLHGLMPGQLPWSDFEKVWKDFFIPGDRNFMVTYDGTMWAMNAITSGLVMGSSIVGGRLMGTEIGIGWSPCEDKRTWVMDRDSANRECDFFNLIPPTDTLRNIAQSASQYMSFYVDQDGTVTANKMRIYGGSIDIGHFHILGKYDEKNELNPDYGRLVQTAESDFVGPVHIYGNIGVAPILGVKDGSFWDENQSVFEFQGSGQGNIYQARGLVCMGIPIPYDEKSNFQYAQDASIEQIAQKKFYQQIFQKNAKNAQSLMGIPWYADTSRKKSYSDIIDRRYSPIWSKASAGNPNIGTGTAIEQNSFFGIDTTSTGIPSLTEATIGPDGQEILTAHLNRWQGHFWPLHFHFGHSNTLTEYEHGGAASDPMSEPGTDGPWPYRDKMFTFVTVMNQFACPENATRVTGGGQSLSYFPNYQVGDNYFRIGPWGSEGIFHFIRKEFQDENRCTPPTDQYYLGWFGKVNRWGTGGSSGGDAVNADSPGIGITSWSLAPIILNADTEISLKSRNQTNIYANQYLPVSVYPNATTTPPGSIAAKGTHTTNDGQGVVGIFGSVFAEDDYALGSVYMADPKGDAYKFRKNRIQLHSGNGFVSMSVQNEKQDGVSAINKAGADWEVIGQKNIAGILADPWGIHKAILTNEGGTADTQPAGISMWTTEGSVHIFRPDMEGKTEDWHNHREYPASPLSDPATDTGHANTVEFGLTEICVHKDSIRMNATEAFSFGLWCDPHQIGTAQNRNMFAMDYNNFAMVHENAIFFSVGEGGFSPAGDPQGESSWNNGITIHNGSINIGREGNYNGYKRAAIQLVNTESESYIDLVGEWAKEDNQRHIYARFA